MITETLANLRRPTGDMLSTRLPAIAHGCNVDGLMGAGVAKVIRNLYPEVFPPYAAACASKFFTPGSMLPIQVNDSRWVLNMATQDRPGPHARLEWIEESLEAVYTFCEETGLEGFAIPRIGAGIGGLEWEDVHDTIWNAAAAHPSIKTEIWTLG